MRELTQERKKGCPKGGCIVESERDLCGNSQNHTGKGENISGCEMHPVYCVESERVIE